MDDRSMANRFAIVGIGCRFPGNADTPERFWELLRTGVDAIREVPPQRFNIHDLYDADPSRPGKLYSRWGGFIDDVDAFDADFFGISPREAVRIDPQQRLLLEVVWEALEDGGQPADRIAGSRTGIFIGISTHDYYELTNNPANRHRFDAYGATGTALSIAANRISYAYDLRGPSMAVDTACSSSLTALHLACRSLTNQECDLAIAGGVNVYLTPEVAIGFCRASMLSPDGRCKSFDAAANGFVRGEGAGVVVIKPLASALADGDRIYAVVRGTAVNQDGRTTGLMVPNADAQEALIRDALRNAGVAPHELQYVEAHGTGTRVGDPIEASAIGRVLAEGRHEASPCLIGSVKTNIGHLEAAAGIAGVIKTALALEAGQIPPSLHFRDPNPDIPLERLRLHVTTSLTPWPRNGRPALAGVNAFGFGGANAHAVLEEPPRHRTTSLGDDGVRVHVLAVSARHPDALHALVQRYRELLAQEGAPSLSDVCYSASARRSHHTHRAAFVGATRDELIAQLDAFADAFAADAGARDRAGAHGAQPKLAFVFTGMGPQWWAMGRQLLESEPVFRAAIEECDAHFRAMGTWSLLDALTAGEQNSRVDQADLAPAANFAIQVGLYRLWRSWGIEPDAIIGHSAGEIGACWAAGVLTLDDALCIAFHRGRLQARAAGTGTMLAAGIPEARAKQLVDPVSDRVSIAAVNSPTSVTLSGERAALEAMAAELTSRGRFNRFLPVEVPYHAPALEAVRDEFLASLAPVAPHAPAVPLVSTVTGDRVRDLPLDAGYWYRNLREPVRFAAAVDRLIDDGIDVFLEIGPHPVLAASIGECVSARSAASVALPSIRRNEEERRIMLRTLAALYERGARVDWSALYSVGTLVRLPAYAWQRERYWFEPEAWGAGPAGVDSGHPLLGHRLRAVQPTWEVDLGASRLDYLDDHRVQGLPVFPAAAYVELALAAAQQLTPGTEPVLEELTFFKALFLTHRRETVLHFEHDGPRNRFQIHSGAKDGSSGWTRHAAGRIGAQPAYAPAEAIATIAARCETGATIEEVYAALEARGLTYQGAFRGIATLRRGQGEALACIDVDARDTADYRVHPVLLDSAFQTVLAAAESIPDATKKPGLYLPVSIRRITVAAEPGDACWSHAVVTRFDADALEGDVTLLRDDGTTAMRVEGLRCRALDAAAAHDRNPADELLYRFEWEPAPLRRRGDREAVPLPGAPELSARMQGVAAELDRAHGFNDRLARMEPQADEVAVRFARAALLELGWTPASAPQREQDGGASLGILPRHARFFRHLSRTVRVADAGGTGNGSAAIDASARERRAADALCERLAADFPDSPALIHLLRTCGHGLAGILMGAADPNTVLFSPEAAAAWTMLFTDEPCYVYYNQLIADTVAAAVTRLPIDTTLRVLEIGAGTGGTTRPVLDQLAGRAIEYHFTDVSPSFLAAAREQFRDRPDVRVASLNIESDPIAQLGDEPFDLIIAANVIHATAELATSLRHVRALLAPGGLFVQLEATRGRWMDLIFGVTEGWWRFTDVDVRPDHPLLSPPRWREVLNAAGLEGATAVSEPHGAAGPHETMLLATAPRGEPRPRITARGARGWLLVEDRTRGAAQRLAALLTARGDRCVTVQPSSDYARDGFSVRIALDQPEHVQRLVSELAADNFSWHGVIDFSSLDAPSDADALAADDVVDLCRRACAPFITVLQGFEKAGRAVPPVWLVTAGAQPVQPDDPPLSLLRAPLWGMGRVLANELVSARCCLIDLSANGDGREIAALADELDADELEQEVAFRGGQRYVARLRRTTIRAARAAARPRAFSPDDHAFRLELDTPGMLESITLHETTLLPLAPDQVRIRVLAAGVNFRDVMFSLGLLPPMSASSGAGLGCECAGIVVASGANVTHVQPGDEVVAVAPGSFASQVVTHGAMVARKPAGLSFEQAVTVPVVFSTVHYGFTQLARLAPGERVLIHAATGGVGLAAIQLARRAGAHIFATAGSPEKRTYLRALGIEHVFDSRGLSFVDDVLAATNGEGVDVVLNSLAGEAIPRGLALLRPYGRFLELGKRDVFADAPIGLLPFARNLSFSCIALDQMWIDRPEYIGELLREILQLVDDGALEPIPHTAWDLADGGSALRFLAQAKHIGKVVLTAQRPSYDVVPGAHGPLCRSDGTYLITGGLGGFGLAVAQWLADQGAGSIVLIGRRGAPSPENAAAFDRLRQSAARVVVIQGDVARETDVRRVLTQIRTELPPLRGIVHTAMVVDDALLAQVTPERFRAVLAPKVGGAWNLHRLTQSDPLDFFLMFSSVASLLGTRSQGNYAAANGFLDALAHHRRTRGLPALTINWGALSEVGYVAQHREVLDHLGRHGLAGISPAEAMLALEQALPLDVPQLSVLRLDWTRWSAIDDASAIIRKSKRLSDFITGDAAPAEGARAERGALLSRLAAAPAGERPALLQQLLTERIARVLGTSPAKVDPAVRLNDMGIDSLMAVELLTIIEGDFHVTLPLAALLEGTTTTQLAARLFDQLALDRTAAPLPDAPPTAPAAPITPVDAGDEQTPTAFVATAVAVDAIATPPSPPLVLPAPEPAPVVPAGTVAASAQARIGSPIQLDPGEKNAAVLESDADRVMEAIAAMLPPAHRGVYSVAADQARIDGAASPVRISERLARYTRDPFGGFFEGRQVDDILEPGSLFDTPAVRRSFELLAAGLPESLYTFHLPLQERCAPETSVLGDCLLFFSTYSYLGLAGHPRINAAVRHAMERFGTSTGGVRLLTGTSELHLELEHELAQFLGHEAAATFGSGYDANIAAITSLFGPGDWVMLDQYAHQSIHDGVRMAGCETRRFRHNDMEDLERRIRQARHRGARRLLIAVDAVFSMDGDQAPLADLIAIKAKHGAFLLVDEAHSMGAVGATGRGICEAQNIDPAGIDIVTGSLSKGIPSSGGFVAGARPLKIYIQHGSAPYLFSAAMTPPNAAAVLETLRLLMDEPEHVQRLRRNENLLRDGLRARGFELGNSSSPVVPLLLGDEWRAYRWARGMLDLGVFVSAVVYPAVSPGQARLRLCATAAHRPEHFERLFNALEECRNAETVS